MSDRSETPQKSANLTDGPSIERPSHILSSDVLSTELDSKNHEDQSNYSKVTVIVYCLMAVMPGILFAIGIGYSAHMNTILIKNKFLTHDDLSLYASILTIGGMLGSLIAGFWSMDAIGRKYTIFMSAVIAFVGFAIHLCLLDLQIGSKIDLRSLLICARFIVGIGVGMGLVAAPVYVAEVSPVKMFHYTANFYQIYIGFGFVILNVVSFATDRVDTKNKLPIMVDYLQGRIFTPVVSMAVCFIQGLFALIIPHSPVWMATKKKYFEKEGNAIAKNNKRLYKSKYNFDQLMMQSSSLSGAKTNKFNFAAFFRPLTLKVLLISTVMMFYQQFSGINPIIFNASIIFSNAGLKQETLGLVILGLAHFFGAVAGVIISSYVGKKYIIVGTSTVIGIVHLIFGIHTRYLISDSSLSWLPVLLLVIFLVAFNFGWGPVPFIINSIFYPNETTNLGSGIGIMINWIFAFIITYPYFIMQDAMGLDGVFFFFSAIMFSAAILCSFLMHEFHGKSKEQIVESIDKSLINTKFK